MPILPGRHMGRHPQHLVPNPVGLLKGDPVNIPDKAVEAAARTRHAIEVREGFYQSEKFQQWETLGKRTRKGYLDEARLSLEAAAPFLMAHGWDECVDFYSVTPDQDDNPYREDT